MPSPRAVPLLALILGAAAAVACWLRLGSGEETLTVDVTLREIARTSDRVVYATEIVVNVVPEITTVKPSGDWVRWDPEDTSVDRNSRRLAGKVTVGTKAGPGSGIWILVAGRPVRFVETRP